MGFADNYKDVMGHLTSTLTLAFSLSPPVWAAMIKTKLTRLSGPMTSSPLRTLATRTVGTGTHSKTIPAPGKGSVSALSMIMMARNRMSSPSKQVIIIILVTRWHKIHDFVSHHAAKLNFLYIKGLGQFYDKMTHWRITQVVNNHQLCPDFYSEDPFLYGR